MPNIKPVSDLRNYNTVLSEVTYGSPVYLTKNGRGDCVHIIRILDERQDFLRILFGLHTMSAETQSYWNE